MLEEIIASAKEQAAERLASPLLGGFAVAWCVWNYKFIVILFSEASVSTTFAMIHSIAFPDLWTIVSRGVVLPLLTAAAYIFLYPYPARLVYGFTLRRQREVNELRRLIENETPLTLEESRTLKTEVLADEARHQVEVDRLNAELLRAKEDLKRPRPGTSSSLKGSIRPNLSSSQLKILGVLKEIGGAILQGSLVAENDPRKVQMEFDLGELERLKLVKKDYRDGANDWRYELTQEGRRVVLGLTDDELEKVSA
jgi:hypothetical protein